MNLLYSGPRLAIVILLTAFSAIGYFSVLIACSISTVE